MLTRSQIYGDVDAIIAGSPTLFCNRELQIMSIENFEAAAYWCSGTNWCVGRNPWFEGYIAAGPLFLLRSFVRNRDYMLAPAHGEFRSRRNRRVSLSRFVAEHRGSYLPLRWLGVFWHDHSLDGMEVFYAKSSVKEGKKVRP